ncbi:hypothetical protein PU345_003703 [Enterobacter kobei]|nr:hypothetical protein [Enterobacter kobei]
MRTSAYLFIFISLISTKVLAFGTDMTVSEDYHSVLGGTGNPGETGLSLQGTWLRNNKTGYALGGVAGFGIPLGRFTLIPESGLLYLSTEKGEDGTAVVSGGKLSFELSRSISLFGKYIYAPDGLSDNIKSYRDYNAGVCYTILRPVSFLAGYRHAEYTSSDDKNKTLANGIYLGASVWF